MNASTTCPETVEALLDEVSREYPALSARLKLIARHVERYREQLAHWDIRQFAGLCGVQPSAIVRFAQYFGFSGFAEMRALFRQRWSDRSANPNHEAEENLMSAVATSVLDHNIVELRNLRQMLDRASLERMVDMFEEAKVVWIVGTREAFPVAAYLEQGLRRVGVQAYLLGGFENLHANHTNAIRKGDSIFALTLGADTQETLGIVKYGVKHGAKLAVLSSNPMSLLMRSADASLTFRDATDCSLRAVATAISLAQVIYVALDRRIAEGGGYTRSTHCTLPSALVSKSAND
ncbi:MurR/RpiR family transcriptional regulator [Paraburkholderia bannensis]|uniref:MurR/RpiR family transcriptional regulator n=1 Tax=Paraburkholderia bannensis TaxID=765414 RepID=UPI002AB650F7|nr:MurR/RpiR family transcriptional regulator [Paraburkholderia bannensis]